VIVVAKSIFTLRMSACKFTMSVVVDFATTITLGAFYSLAGN
jgi:hypothetical protein